MAADATPTDGRTPLPLHDAIARAAAHAAAHAAGDYALLTVSELEALQAAAHGLTIQESADVLEKSAETIKSQRNSVLLKLRARNMTHAVCLGTAAGVVDAAQVSAPEQRAHPRLQPATEFAVLVHSPGRRRSGHLLDVSGGGLLFSTEDFFEEDELLYVAVLRVGEEQGVSGLRLRVVAVRDAGERVVHAAFVERPPERWLDRLAVAAPGTARRAATPRR